jgi:hypothetical protein
MKLSEIMRRREQVVGGVLENGQDASKVPLCMQAFWTNELLDSAARVQPAWVDEPPPRGKEDLWRHRSGSHDLAFVQEQPAHPHDCIRGLRDVPLGTASARRAIGRGAPAWPSPRWGSGGGR